MLQHDSSAACVYLYRIIEYYAFFMTAQQMSTLRHDRTVSDADFSRKMMEVAFRDEKGPLHRTISTIVDHVQGYPQAPPQAEPEDVRERARS